jgi:hypothetical protein
MNQPANTPTNQRGKEADGQQSEHPPKTINQLFRDAKPKTLKDALIKAVAVKQGLV